MLKKIYFLLIASLSSTYVYSMVNEEIEYNNCNPITSIDLEESISSEYKQLELNSLYEKEFLDNPKTIESTAFKNFDIDKNLIDDCLNQIKQAELHFFWTTGRTLSDNNNYQPNTQVDVGGSKYGKKFFSYVDKLLEVSPSHLKVKLVADDLTIKSNENYITGLLGKYGNRFEILHINKVQDNLFTKFSSEEQKLKCLFKNATQGSPVIASDIYRIIGMAYGQNHESEINQTQYTYCDIDAFCYGMEALSHRDLIKSLFSSVVQEPFYFGRSRTNNDLIKLCISNIKSYEEFCCQILSNIYIDAEVLTYFSNLHDRIKLCEQVNIEDINIDSIIDEPIKDLILAVTLTTGPKFLFDKRITTNLSYPSVTIGEWYAPEEILDYTYPGYSAVRPPSILDWGSGDASAEEKKVCDAFEMDCDHYRKVLSAAFYAKRFGKNHPFNVRINTYLQDYFPYRMKSFKDLLRVNFNFHHKDKEQRYSLKLMTDFDLEEEGFYEEKTVYLEKVDGGLKCTLATSNNQTIDLILDIQIDEKLSSRVLRKFKSEIHEKLSQHGLNLEPKKGLSYEDWKNKAFSRITKSNANHYAVLIRVLKKLELDIDVTLTQESIDFQNH
ncbi:MAG: hypothetical protein Q8S31_00435 [Alphaproteobacteria bacterium]|nr:hypothetical protein [Alphaproteobacteria bacterium]